MRPSDQASPISSADCMSPKSKLSALEILHGFKDLYENQLLADFTICVENQTIKIHKVILIIRSSYFKRLFQTQCKEADSNEVVITDFSYRLVKQMLSFMYTGDATINRETAQDLLAISQKYDVKLLKKECETFLTTTLSVDTALDILVLADRHQALHLEDATLAFIKRNYSELRDTEAWSGFRHTYDMLHEKITDVIAGYSPSKKKSKPN